MNMMELAEAEHRTWKALSGMERESILRRVLKDSPLAYEVAGLAIGRDLVWITCHMGEQVSDSACVEMARRLGGKFN